MYPLFRLLTVSLKALRAPKNSFNSIGTCSFYAHPWDIDMFGEMNNGRHLTLYDLGRFDIAIKCGLGKVLKNNKWGLVVAGGTIRYRKRIRMFNKITMKTQLVAMDDRWFYLNQVMYVKGNPCSAALLRTGITRGGSTVPTAEVAQAMGLSDLDLKPEKWVQAWINADDQRSWPPEFEEAS